MHIVSGVGMAALVALFSFTDAAPSLKTRDDTEYDAIIVGAGFSGIATAKALQEQGKTFKIIEARERVGGRVMNHYFDSGDYMETGAEFIGPTQDKSIEWSNELGLALVDEYDSGNDVLYYKGGLQQYDANGPLGSVPTGVGLGALALLEGAQVAIDALAASINPEDKFSWALAKHYDGVTFSDFLGTVGVKEGTAEYFLIETSIEQIFSATAKDLSAFYVMYYTAAAGNSTTTGTFERLYDVKDAAQAWRVADGTQELAIGQANKIGLQHFSFGNPVTKISSSDSGVTVTTKSGEVFKGKKAVVAMSPAMSKYLIYEPELPKGRKVLHDKMAMGHIGKFSAQYSKPWWREKKLTGQALSDAGLARGVFDQTPYNASEGRGYLFTFLQPPALLDWKVKPYEQIKDECIKNFAQYFGEEANDYTDWYVKIWDFDEWSQGGPEAGATPGFIAEYGEYLTKPHGNIHWAGTESSDYWIGYMDGAIRSGYRVANELF